MPAEAAERASSLRDDSYAHPPESSQVTVSAMGPNTADTPASEDRLLASSSHLERLRDTTEASNDVGGDSGSVGGPVTEGTQ